MQFDGLERDGFSVSPWAPSKVRPKGVGGVVDDSVPGFCRQATSALSSFCGRDVLVSCSESREARVSDVLGKVPFSSTLCVSALAPSGAPMGWFFGAGLQFLVTDLLFGGDGRFHRPEGGAAGPGPVEARVCARLSEIFGKAMASSWEAVCGKDLSPCPAGMEDRDFHGLLGRDSDRVVFFRGAVESMGVSETFLFCMSKSVVPDVSAPEGLGGRTVDTRHVPVSVDMLWSLGDAKLSDVSRLVAGSEMWPAHGDAWHVSCASSGVFIGRLSGPPVSQGWVFSQAEGPVKAGNVRVVSSVKGRVSEMVSRVALEDVPVRLEVRVGSRMSTIGEIGSLSNGSLLTLDQEAGSEAVLLANGKEVAVGEVAEINGKYGFRVSGVSGA